MFRRLIHISFFLSLMLAGFRLLAQPYATINLDKDKPKQYSERKLPSENTGNKKLGAVGRFFQNGFTHYNYYFNANNKVNEIINNAKAGSKDDYTQLLPFYNYTLTATAQYKQDIDSVKYKCTSGILLHDLRNDWIDNLYLLLGKAYLLNKQFDSANYIFQYINYAWAPKDDGYDIPIGSNASNTNGIFTVATKESNNIVKKAIFTPPSRNESFIWQARNYLEQDKIAEAYSLLSILRSDPNFPDRLQASLHEMFAYAYYKQQVYDSAAWHLSKALDNAYNRFETARWEYLCGQLYQLANKNEDAIQFFNRAIQHTPDPVMEVYARINIVNAANDTKNNALQEKLNELYKLAKKERYKNYWHLIYYAIATLELRNNNNLTSARLALNKSLQYNIDDKQQKQKTFLLLADIDYDDFKFQPSYNFYDSTQTFLLKPIEKEKVDTRKPPLKIIAANLTLINKEDSLQRIAGMSETEMVAFVKKVLRQLRKAEGLKDIGNNANDYGNTSAGNNTQPGLFTNNSSGSFYFLNDDLKQKGFAEFKAKWGNRPNVDYWQRQSALAKTFAPTNLATDVDNASNSASKTKPVSELTLDDLMKNIPLSAAQLDVSNTSVEKALLENGTTFQNELQNYPAAIQSYEQLAARFHNSRNTDQVLFNLLFCYKQTGQLNKADSLALVLKSSYPKSKYTSILVNGINSNKVDDATMAYQRIYNAFIEGDFEKAKEEKTNADKLYGKSYWTPQLLYIEALYYVKQKQDSIAINRLQSLTATFPKSGLAEKANTMIDVLKRRNEIENYLTNLDVTKTEDIAAARVELNNKNVAAINAPNVAKDSNAVINKNIINKAPAITPNIAPAKPAVKSYTFNPTEQHYVGIVLDKVDIVFVNEARNAFIRYNQTNYYNQKLSAETITIDDQYKLLLIGGFNTAGDAVNYIDKTKPLTGTSIVPWLQANKYSYTIISNNNLGLLKEKKDIHEYKQFIQQIFPDKF